MWVGCYRSHDSDMWAVAIADRDKTGSMGDWFGLKAQLSGVEGCHSSVICQLVTRTE